MWVGHGTTSRPQSGLDMGLKPGVNPSVLRGCCWTGRTIAMPLSPQCTDAKSLSACGAVSEVGWWVTRTFRQRQAYVDTRPLAAIARRGCCEERGKRYGNCVKRESATSELALTRDGGDARGRRCGAAASGRRAPGGFSLYSGPCSFSTHTHARIGALRGPRLAVPSSQQPNTAAK